MGVLVEDMLLLARLDQQRPLEHRTVDLLTLAADAVHDARVVAPDRSINLTVGAGAALLVLGDEVRLRQVIGNLMSNALAHTPDGTPIDVRIRSGSLSEAPSYAQARPPVPPPSMPALGAERARHHRAGHVPARARPARRGRAPVGGRARGGRPRAGAHPGAGRARVRALLPGRPGPDDRRDRPGPGHRGRAGGGARRRGVGRSRRRVRAPRSAIALPLAPEALHDIEADHDTELTTTPSTTPTTTTTARARP